MLNARQNQPSRQRGRQTPARDPWQRGKRWLVGGGVAGAVALLVVLTSALSGPEPAAGRELAPDMVLATANGEFQLSDQRGKVSLLYFSPTKGHARRNWTSSYLAT